MQVCHVNIWKVTYVVPLNLQGSLRFAGCSCTMCMLCNAMWLLHPIGFYILLSAGDTLLNVKTCPGVVARMLQLLT